jgi:hypothetical protein
VPVADIVTPSAGQGMASNQALILQWTGIGAPPTPASVSPRTRSCVIAFRQVSPDTFIPERDETQSEHEPPCLFQVSAEWLVEQAPPPPPFRSLAVVGFTRRIQRFIVQ